MEAGKAPEIKIKICIPMSVLLVGQLNYFGNTDPTKKKFITVFATLE